jgi:ubiquinone/menaquinone biosynthesis C-methylase UbiE
VKRWLAVFLRLFFRLLYHEFAWSYDLVAWLVSLGRWKRWVFTSLPYLTGPRILELGHGPGHLQAALADKGFCVAGLDASRQMGKQAYLRLQREKFQPRLVRARAPALPFAPQSFNQVVATFPTEYILQADTLANIQRLLSPGGVLVLIPFAWITGRSFLDSFAAWLFKVTGEAPVWDARWLLPLNQAGFSVSTQLQDLGDSQVMVILAQKL